jgi:hypothetical protein
MPPEGWLKSKDREFLFEQLYKDDSLRYKTAQEVYLRHQYKSWPWYRFKGYFKDALIIVLKKEAIARQDNIDFQSLFKNNPRPKLTSNGEYNIVNFDFSSLDRTTYF